MFQFENVFFDLIVFSLEKVKCGYSMDDLENTWIVNFSIRHMKLDNYDEDFSKIISSVSSIILNFSMD